MACKKGCQNNDARQPCHSSQSSAEGLAEASRQLCTIHIPQVSEIAANGFVEPVGELLAVICVLVYPDQIGNDPFVIQIFPLLHQLVGYPDIHSFDRAIQLIVAGAANFSRGWEGHGVAFFGCFQRVTSSFPADMLQHMQDRGLWSLSQVDCETSDVNRRRYSRSSGLRGLHRNESGRGYGISPPSQ